MTMKLTPTTLLFLLLFPVIAPAQQNADVESWRKEYADRFQSTVERRLKQKPEFTEDARFSKPDYIVFIPSVEPEKLGDTYDDHFQVFDKPDGKLFALWCQATVEGALDQHVSFSRSFDKGKTWESPKVLAGNRTVSEGLANGGAIASWAFPLVSKSGRIYILYNQFIPGKVSTNRQHTGLMMGIYSDDDGETWTKPENIPMPRSINDPPNAAIPPEWVVWQKPLRLGKNSSYLVGVSRYAHPSMHSKYRTLTEFIHFDNVDEDPPIQDLVVRWVQTNDKALHIGVYCEEPAIVKLPDGRLFCVMRTGMGSPYWTQSCDDGETWTVPKPLLTQDGGEPIPHPISPCPIYDAKGNEAASGLYFMFAHNTFDKQNTNPWQIRGPLFLFSGRFQKDAEQPVWFDTPKRFIDRPTNNSFYTSLTVLDGKTVLWYPDQKFYLLGKYIDDRYFDGKQNDAKQDNAERIRNVLILGDKADEMPELRQRIQSGGWTTTQLAQNDWNATTSEFDAIVVYIHEPIVETVEKALIDYAEQGGRLLVVHHAIASAKMQNPRWLEFLGVKIVPKSAPDAPWFVSGDVAFTVVNLAPKHYITSNDVVYDKTVEYRSTTRKELDGEFPAFVLEHTEIFHNQRNTDADAKIPLLAYRLDGQQGAELPVNVPAFDETAGWLKKTGQGWTVYLQPGHAPSDFRHPIFGQILMNALDWKE